MADTTVNIDWQIANTDVLQTNVVGNDANRFDAWRQTGTLGPYPPTAADGPPETNGDPGTTPSATT